MNTTRMIGLGLVVALATVALAFASGASAATVLCSANNDPCSEGQVYATSQELEGTTTGVNVTFDTDTEDVTCPTSSWEGKALTNLQGEFSSGEISGFTFNAATCKVQPANVACTALTAKSLPYGLALGVAGGGNGSMEFVNGGNGVPLIEIDCGAGRLQCSFVFPELSFEVAGGTPAIVKGTSGATEWKGTKCPKKEAKFIAEYKVTEPVSLFLVSAVKAPVLCGTTPGPCPTGKALPTGTTLTASLKAASRFIYTVNGKTKEPECTTGSLTGKTTAAGDPLIGELTAFEFSNCGGGSCTPIKSENAPYRFEIENWINSDDGDFTMLKQSKGPPTIRLACGSIFEECIYGPTTGYFKFNLNGGAPAEIYWPSKVTMKLESGSSLLCGSTATWEGATSAETNYKVTAPNPLYVETEA